MYILKSNRIKHLPEEQILFKGKNTHKTHILVSEHNLVNILPIIINMNQNMHLEYSKPLSLLI